MLVLVINPGAVTTKIAVFSDETGAPEESFSRTIDHGGHPLEQYEKILDQAPYRRSVIESALRDAGYTPSDFCAVIGRGGLLRHIPSGTYAVDEAVLRDLRDPPYGEHASNLGAVLAKDLADEAGIPAYFADPVSTDELEPLARYSGLHGIERESFFHALNQKSIARRASAELGRPYGDLNLIVAHLGGGVSVAAHCHGRVIDNYNVKDDGAMGLDRAGALPVNAVVNLCYSARSKAEVKRLIGTNAGVFSYLGTRDFREVERRAFSGEDPKALEVFRAMAYQLAKDIGSMAAVLRFRVDAVVYTGGMARCRPFVDEIASYVGALAPSVYLPGENEMRALAEASFRALHGEPVKSYSDEILIHDPV